MINSNTPLMPFGKKEKKKKKKHRLLTSTNQLPYFITHYLPLRIPIPCSRTYTRADDSARGAFFRPFFPLTERHRLEPCFLHIALQFSLWNPTLMPLQSAPFLWPTLQPKQHYGQSLPFFFFFFFYYFLFWIKEL